MTREEAVDFLSQYVGNDCYTEKCQEAHSMAVSALRPVSRERVILCRDCRFWQDNNGGYPHPECRWGNDETPDADDYCSFAERKSEDIR